MSTNLLRILSGATLGVILLSTVRAEEVEKRFRVGLSVGGYHTNDEVRSDSANQMVLVDPEIPSFRDLYEDPRNDGAAIGTLAIKPSIRLAMSGQYAFTKIFLLEGTVGYQKGDVGDVEMQAELNFDVYDTTRNRFNFKVFRFGAGEMTQVPIELTAVWRFRPKTTFNPFFGLGGGYTFVQFDSSSQLDEVSLNMDNAEGAFAVQSAFPGRFGSELPPEALQGATVEVEDYLEWHADAGFEYAIAKKWSFVFDLKYTFTNGTFRLRFNGKNQLGVSVPNGEFDRYSPQGTATYGTYSIPAGLIDAGCLVPTTAVTQDAFVCVPPDQIATVCPPPVGNEPPDCVLRFPGPNSVLDPANPTNPPVSLNLATSDGVPDGGFYYVRGGDIHYGGPSLHLGVRFTF